MPLYIEQSGDLDRCYRCLTLSLTTLKERATQLLIKYKSGALVTQYVTPKDWARLMRAVWYCFDYTMIKYNCMIIIKNVSTKYVTLQQIGSDWGEHYWSCCEVGRCRWSWRRNNRYQVVTIFGIIALNTSRGFYNSTSLPTHRAGKEEAQPTIVKETAKAKLKSGLGIARMTGSIMANVDVEEKLEREDNLQISLF